MLDSAKYYLCMIDNTASGSNEAALVIIREYSALAAIAQKEGNMVHYHDYADKCKLLTDSINNNKHQYSIQFIEKR